MDLSKFSEEQRRLIVSNLLVTQEARRTARNFKHVPCKFFKKGACQAGASCPFSHSVEAVEAASRTPCKYFLQGNCRFGARCANSHNPADAPAVPPPNENINRRGGRNRRHGGARDNTAVKQPFPPQRIYPELADEPNYVTSNTNYFGSGDMRSGNVPIAAPQSIWGNPPAARGFSSVVRARGEAEEVPGAPRTN